MTSRKSAATLLLVIIGVSAIAYTVFLMPDSMGPEVVEDTEIVPHSYNYLNWWDVAWEIPTTSYFLTPLTSIAAFGPRRTGAAGYYDAADWLIDHLTNDAVELSYWGAYDSVVGYQKGYGTDNRAIVFGAHLDTEEGAARGIDQNLGGVAVVSMIAQTLSQFRLPIDVYYCFFAGNCEYSDGLHMVRQLFGSKEVSEELSNEGVDVIAFYNFDHILFRNPDQDNARRLHIEHESLVFTSYHRGLYLAELLEAFMMRSGTDIANPLPKQNFNTDDRPFRELGFPAVNVISGHSTDPSNSPADLLSESLFDKDQGELLGRAASALAVYLALQGNGTDTLYKLEGDFEPYESRTTGLVLTTPQAPVVRGFASEANLSISIRNSTHTLHTQTVDSGNNFSFVCSQQAGLGYLFLTVQSISNNTAHVATYIECASDSDGNGVTDADQYSWPAPNPPLDWDKDGLSDIKEKEIGTDIFVIDTDMDTISDSIEWNLGMDPLRNDFDEDIDEDGLVNGREVSLGTHPLKNDTDSDHMPDFWEVTFGTDPLTDDQAADDDGDSLTNLQEYLSGADPKSSDGDFDGLSDSEEVALGTNPLDDDTDHDGLKDRIEVLEGLNPLFPDSDVDLDPDGLDHNPRINALLVIGLLAAIPIIIGTLAIWRRLKI